MATKLIQVAVVFSCVAVVGTGCQKPNKIAGASHTSLFDQIAQSDSQKDAVKVRPRLTKNGLKPQKALWKKKVSLADASSRKLNNAGDLNKAYGALLEQTKNYDKAQVAYENTLKEDPNSVDAILGIARIDLLSGRSREAERGFLKAIELRPNDSHVRASYGQFLVLQSRWPEAVSELRTALNLAPENQSYRFSLAIALVQTDRVREAYPLLVQMVGEAEAHYNIGFLHFQNKDFERAERRFQQALMLKPELKQASIMQNEIVKLAQAKSPRRSKISQVGYERSSSSRNSGISLNPSTRKLSTTSRLFGRSESLTEDNVSEFIGHSRPPKR